MRRGARLGLVGLGLVLATPAAAANCGMYPPEVYSKVHSPWSDCVLKRFGEKPLWKGLTSPKYRQQIRFTITHGHSAYVHVIDFAELLDGSGRIDVRTFYKQRRGHSEQPRRFYRVPAPEVATLNRLAGEAGVWELPISSWDGDEWYMHCKMLDMERVDASGFSLSSLSIGCNRPRKLMPFVSHMARLARIKPDEQGNYIP